MVDVVLFGFLPDWARNTITPLWLLGLGSAAGLVLLLLGWLLVFLLTRIPGWSDLADKPAARRNLVVVLGVVFSALLGYWGWQSWDRWSGGGELPAETAGLGALLLTAVGFSLAFLLIAYSSKRQFAEIPLALREGVLVFILGIAGVLAALGILGTFAVRNPGAILTSLTRLSSSGVRVFNFTVPAAPGSEGGNFQEPPQQTFAVNLRKTELRSVSIESNQSLEVTAVPIQEGRLTPTMEVRGGETYRWARGELAAEMFPEEQIAQLYVRNLGSQEAQVEVRATVVPEFPEVSSIPLTAVAVAGVILLYLLQRAALPKAFAVAHSTAKSEVAQPLYLILLLIGLVSLVLFLFIPYNTFGEDIKMLKDSGMVLIMVLGIIEAVWASSVSIADEIEGRTALTVLSKPIGRRSFITGKFLGIFWAVALLFIILGIWFLGVVSYKPIYDAVETSQESPTWQICHFEVVRVVPGLILAFLETILLAAISVAISTRLPMLANFIICFSIYVLGHLTPLLVQSSVEGGAFEAVVFVAQLIAVVFPVLDHFNIQPAVAAGIGVPYDYLGWALLYCVIYGAIALLLALLLFEDRDLA